MSAADRDLPRTDGRQPDAASREPRAASREPSASDPLPSASDWSATDDDNLDARLYAYVDGGLTAAESVDMDALVAARPGLRERVDELRAFQDHLGRGLKADLPAPRLTDRRRTALLSAAADLAARRRRQRRWALIRHCAAAVLVLGALGAATLATARSAGLDGTRAFAHANEFDIDFTGGNSASVDLGPRAAGAPGAAAPSDHGTVVVAADRNASMPLFQDGWFSPAATPTSGTTPPGNAWYAQRPYAGVPFPPAVQPPPPPPVIYMPLQATVPVMHDGRVIDVPIVTNRLRAIATDSLALSSGFAYDAAKLADAEAAVKGLRANVDDLVAQNAVTKTKLGDAMAKDVATYKQLLGDAKARRLELKQEEERAAAGRIAARDGAEPRSGENEAASRNPDVYRRILAEASVQYESGLSGAQDEAKKTRPALDDAIPKRERESAAAAGIGAPAASGGENGLATSRAGVDLLSREVEGIKRQTIKDNHVVEVKVDELDAALKKRAREQLEEIEVERAKGDREQGLALAKESRRAPEEALKQKVDELLRRSRVASGEQDFKRAETAAWNAYELDRSREDARLAYLDARRKSQQQFDAGFREETLERVAKVEDELHKAMNPQNEPLVRPEAQALAGQRVHARGLYSNQIADQLSVDQQRLWVESQARVEEGRAHLARGDFAAAERAFQTAHVRLDNLPAADSRRESAQLRVEALLAEARTKRARQDLETATLAATSEKPGDEQIRREGLAIDRDRIDAMVARAQQARERKDYDDAVLLLEQVLKLNRAEDRAHELLLACRRERHVHLRQLTADRWDADAARRNVAGELNAALAPIPDDLLLARPVPPAGPVNPWVLAESDRLSTFAIDVDSASYALTRAWLRKGYLPPQGSVRMEEFINAFDYNYDRAASGRTFAVHAQAAPAPFGPAGSVLLRVGVKGRVVGREERKPAHLVLVVDASGSMERADRMPLVKHALDRLSGALDARDRVSLVTYGDGARLVLEGVPATQRAAITDAVRAIQCGGSTNLLDGLRAGFAQARRCYQAGAVNRVVLLSDGVANVGAVDADQLAQQVAGFRAEGITFTSAGFGAGGADDALLERLANRGDGRAVFIDSAAEAERVFVSDLGALVGVIAKDARIQVAFDPARVRRYRLIGYENRAVADQDFRNDAVDAGEVGSGQAATALYELELHEGAGDLGSVRVRWHDVAGGRVEELTAPLAGDLVRPLTPETAPRFFLAACAGEFAELLRGSEHAQGGSLPAVAAVLERAAARLPLDGQVRELLDLVRRAQGLPRAPAP